MSRDRAHSAWKSAETVKKLSDRVIGIGPFGVGLDGILTWIPGAGIVYSAGASAYLLYLALNAGASPGTLTKMAGFLGLDMLLSEFPIPFPVNPADFLDFFWQGHLMAANALQKDIEARHGLPPEHVAKVEKERRKRGRGLGWIGILLLIALGAAFWLSDFRTGFGDQMWPDFLAATVSIAGYTVGLPIVSGAILGLMFLVNIVNRAPRRA